MEERVYVNHTTAPDGINGSHSLRTKSSGKKNISFSHRCVPDIIPCNKLLGSAQCPFQIFWRLCHLVEMIQTCHHILGGLLIHDIGIIHGSALVKFPSHLMLQCIIARFFSRLKVFFLAQAVCQRTQKHYRNNRRSFSPSVIFFRSVVLPIIHIHWLSGHGISPTPGAIRILLL